VEANGAITLIGDYYGDVLVRRLGSTGMVDGTVFEQVEPDMYNTANAAAAMPDGALVVAGSTAQPSASAASPSTLVARFAPGGALDPGFGDGGKRVVAGITDVRAVLALGDGGMLVVGSSTAAEPSAMVVRLDAEGDVDASFGEQGFATADFPGTDTTAGAAVQPDGKVVVAGTSGIDGAIAAARLTRDGRADGSYGVGGMVTHALGSASVAISMAGTADGKVVVSGGLAEGLVVKLAVVRLLGDPPPAAPGPGPAAGGGGGPARDTTAPALRRVRITAARRGKRPRIRFTLSEPARVRLTLKPAARRRGLRFAVDGVAGRNRIRGRRLVARGRHTLVLRAVDAAGNRGPVRRIAFRARR
jgi:uncharacterized delta-60 repeat protein